MKKCRICKEVKPLTDFYKRKLNKDRHRNECKKCGLEYNKQWFKTEKGRELMKISAKRWRDDNPQKYRVSNRKHTFKYYHNNIERCRKINNESHKRNYMKNRDALLKKGKIRALVFYAYLY